MDIQVIPTSGRVGAFEEFERANRHVGAALSRVPRVSIITARQKLRDAGLISPGLVYSGFEARRAWLHTAFWRTAANREEPTTVVEDTARLSAFFISEAPRLLATLPPEWDIVTWGHSFASPLIVRLIPGLVTAEIRPDPSTLARNLDRFSAAPVSATLVPAVFQRGLPCYSLSRRGAGRLLELCLPLRSEQINVKSENLPVRNDRIDFTVSAHFAELSAFACVPPLAVQGVAESGSPASTPHPSR